MKLSLRLYSFRKALLPLVAVGAFALVLATDDHRVAIKSQDSLAKRAVKVLDEHCAPCHTDQSKSGFDYRDRKKLLSGPVDPSNLSKSRILARVLNSPSDPMPPRGSKNPILSQEEKQVLEDWIKLGAPEDQIDRPKVNNRQFVSENDQLATILVDLNSATQDDRQYYRYFTLTHLYNEGLSELEIEDYRLGLNKLLNSLSWKKAISIPHVIGQSKSILRIDLRKFNWDSTQWNRLLSQYPYGVISNDSTAKAIYQSTSCRLPYVRADWFVSNAGLPPLYNDLFGLNGGLPKSATELETLLNIDLKKNQAQRQVIRGGIPKGASGVSNNNRVVERHESPYGYYWRSYDFRTNTGNQEVAAHPLDFKEAGGEIIFSLPNGLQGYMLVDEEGKRIDVGPSDIVDNSKNPQRAPTDPIAVRNGLDCMSCHSQGIKRFNDSIRESILQKDPKTVSFNYEHALALYPRQAKINEQLDIDTEQFVEAVKKCGRSPSDLEPIVALQRQFVRSLDINMVAAEVGLKTEALRNALEKTPQLRNEFSSLLSSTGTIGRDTLEDKFGLLVKHLSLGTYMVTNREDLPVTPPVTNTTPESNGTGLPILLRYRYVMGETWKIRMTGSIKISGEPVTMTMINQTKVVKVGDDGSISLEDKMVDGKVSVGGTDTDFPASEGSVFVIAANGETLEIRGSEITADAYRSQNLMSIVFPKEPVGSGSRWKVEFPAKRTTGAPAYAGQYSILMEEILDGIVCFKISYKTAETEGEIPGKIEGVAWVEKRTGRLIKGTQTWENFPVPGTPVPISGTFTSERVK